MEWEKILDTILDLGTEMLRSGGETHRVEDTLYRLAGSYGFLACNIWVVPTNVQATVTAPSGTCLTRIRHVRGGGIDFDRLDRLNALSRWACANLPEAEDLEARFARVRTASPQRVPLQYLAGVLGGWGFGLFFGCDLLDSLTAIPASLLITFLIRQLGNREGNPLILNFLIASVTELMILFGVHFGLGRHVGFITVGVVMLLISGLGVTNGLRDLVHLDTLSGLMNISAAFTGAIGIALGIALPLYLLQSWDSGEMMQLNASIPIQLLSGTAACVGFALWFHIRGVKILYCGLGALLTWGLYLLMTLVTGSVFGATMAASVFCGLYAQIMARIHKTPATLFSTICVFPLIPGTSLYYTMYGLVTKNTGLAGEKSVELVLTCFGIVLGFMVVEVIERVIWHRAGAKIRPERR